MRYKCDTATCSARFLSLFWTDDFNMLSMLDEEKVTRRPYGTFYLYFLCETFKLKYANVFGANISVETRIIKNYRKCR